MQIIFNTVNRNYILSLQTQIFLSIQLMSNWGHCPSIHISLQNICHNIHFWMIMHFQNHILGQMINA